MMAVMMVVVVVTPATTAPASVTPTAIGYYDRCAIDRGIVVGTGRVVAACMMVMTVVMMTMSVVVMAMLDRLHVSNDGCI